MTSGAAGFDVHAALELPLTLAPGARALVPLGFGLELPPHFEAQIRPRSGLASKHGITCLNSPGTVDADYRGEVMALLINHGDAPFVIERGMRVAQMVVQALPRVTLEIASELSRTERDQSGFGSTGA